MPTSMSSGTYDYRVCVSCIDNGNEIRNSVSVPHPVMINNNGDSVTQLTSVTLGGVNGLNM